MKQLQKPLENRNGTLYFDGVSTTELAEQLDTPLYVVSESRIRENYERLHDALTRNYEKVKIYYAAKANSNLSVLKILETEGAHLDAVSPGEVSMALATGFPAERILFTGTSVRNDELKFLADSNVTVNVDSLSQLYRLLKITVPTVLSVRVNPEIGAGHHDHCITAGKNTKFGLWENNALKAYEQAQKAGVERFGIHMHVGSGVLNTEPFLLALDKLLSVAKKAHDEIGVNFEFVDMGGGLGVPYKPEEHELDLARFSEEVLSLFKSKTAEYGLGEPFFCVEPGRYLVCDASILLTRVNTVKETPFKKFVGVDAGFNTLVRPTMYGSYHHVLVANNLDAPEEETCDVVGPVCESGDMLAKDRRLPRIQEGDLLAILNAGAYGYAMSSQYNARPRAAEVLVKNGKYTLIRTRESLNDLMSGQRMAGVLTMKFWKMHGLGNDYVVIDNRDSSISDAEAAELARKLCRRRFSVGADGILFVTKSAVADVKMRIFNADGSEAEMCGNGIRCFAKYCYENDIARKSELVVETLAGNKRAWLTVENGLVQSVMVDMGVPTLERNEIPMLGEGTAVNIDLQVNGETYKVTCLSVGNPHCVVFVDAVEDCPVEQIGPKIENHSVFPKRTNVEFAQALNENEVKVRVWERGCGETLACGTGACATVVAGNLLKKLGDKVHVHLLGGDLEVEYGERLFLNGPAEKVFEGTLF